MIVEEYQRPGDLAAALALLAVAAPATRLVAGGTDVMVELSRGTKPATRLIDLTALESELRFCRSAGDHIEIFGVAFVAVGMDVQSAIAEIDIGHRNRRDADILMIDKHFGAANVTIDLQRRRQR